MDWNKQSHRSENVRVGRSSDEQRNQPRSEQEDRLVDGRSRAAVSIPFLMYLGPVVVNDNLYSRPQKVSGITRTAPPLKTSTTIARALRSWMVTAPPRAFLPTMAATIMNSGIRNSPGASDSVRLPVLYGYGATHWLIRAVSDQDQRLITKLGLESEKP